MYLQINMPITRSRTSIRRRRNPNFPTEEELEQAYNHARLTLCSRGYKLSEGFAKSLFNPSINDIKDINNIQALEDVIMSKLLKSIEKMQKRIQNSEIIFIDVDDTNRLMRNRRKVIDDGGNDGMEILGSNSNDKREVIIINEDTDDDDNDDEPIRQTTIFPNISPNESIVVSVLIESYNNNNDNDIVENRVNREIREIRRFSWRLLIFLGFSLYFLYFLLFRKGFLELEF
jgi:hypothetical protein